MPAGPGFRLIQDDPGEAQTGSDRTQAGLRHARGDSGQLARLVLFSHDTGPLGPIRGNRNLLGV